MKINSNFINYNHANLDIHENYNILGLQIYNALFDHVIYLIKKSLLIVKLEVLFLYSNNLCVYQCYANNN